MEGRCSILSIQSHEAILSDIIYSSAESTSIGTHFFQLASDIGIISSKTLRVQMSDKSYSTDLYLIAQVDFHEMCRCLPKYSRLLKSIIGRFQNIGEIICQQTWSQCDRLSAERLDSQHPLISLILRMPVAVTCLYIFTIPLLFICLTKM